MYRRQLAAGCFALAVALAGCGGKAVDEQGVQARNLKTGNIETFGSADEVPADYIVCESADCPVPPDVPCQGLGALSCQLHPECKVKVLSCSGDDGVVYLEGEIGSSGDGVPREDPGSVPGSGSELCEVTCVPDGPLACEQIGDPLACQARPECEWGDLICPGVACGSDDPTCTVEYDQGCIAGCFSRPFLSCEDLQSLEQCLSRPECEWLAFGYAPPPCSSDDPTCGMERPCECACAPEDPACVCDCPEVEQGVCVNRTQAECHGLDQLSCQDNSACEWQDGVVCGCPPDAPDCCADIEQRPPQCVQRQMPDCYSLSEQECLAVPECEWGQFFCPMCAIEDSDGSGDMLPCDCPSTCRARTEICAPAPMPAIGCLDGSPLEPIYDPMGCIIGWRCPDPSLYCGGIAGLECPPGSRCAMSDNYPDAMGICVPEACPPVMCEMYCEFGFKVDENGCEICQCKEAPECQVTGCSGQICADKDVFTTCEWTEHYQCYRLAECGITAAGSCGWIRNDAFDECMAGALPQPDAGN